MEVVGALVIVNGVNLTLVSLWFYNEVVDLHSLGLCTLQSPMYDQSILHQHFLNVELTH